LKKKGTIIYDYNELQKKITFEKNDLLEVLDKESNYLVVSKKQGETIYIFKLNLNSARCIDSFMVTSYKEAEEESKNKAYFEITRNSKKEAIKNKEKYVLQYNSKEFPDYIKKCITSSELQYNTDKFPQEVINVREAKTGKKEIRTENFNLLNEDELNKLVFNYDDTFLILGSQDEGDELLVDVIDVRIIDDLNGPYGIFRINMSDECLEEFNLPSIRIITGDNFYNDFIKKKHEDTEGFGFGETNDPEEGNYGGRKSRRRAKNRKTRRRMRLK
jgi:hypothetical protein